jgi:hypothetical protein
MANFSTLKRANFATAAAAAFVALQQHIEQNQCEI